MALESNILLGRNLFVGDDIPLGYTVYVRGTSDFDARNDNGAHEDITTGWTLEWVLSLEGIYTSILTKTTGAGITHDDPAEGHCVVEITTADSGALLAFPTTYTYILRRTDVGEEETIAFGTFTLHPTIT